MLQRHSFYKCKCIVLSPSDQKLNVSYKIHFHPMNSTPTPPQMLYDHFDAKQLNVLILEVLCMIMKLKLNAILSWHPITFLKHNNIPFVYSSSSARISHLPLNLELLQPT